MDKDSAALLDRCARLIPAGVPRDVIRTYAELDRLTSRLMQPGGPNAAIVIGPPGIGKSSPFEMELRRRLDAGEAPRLAISKSGNSEAGVYAWAFENRDKLLVFDDDRALFHQKGVVNMLMALAETRTPKLLTRRNLSPALRKQGIPTSYYTTSRIVVINNSVDSAAQTIKALADRAAVVFFDPPPAEVHAHAKSWADLEVYDFIGANLHLTPYASFRWYVNAAEQRDQWGNPNWRGWLLGTWLNNPTLKLFVEVQHDATLRTKKLRVAAFQRLGEDRHLGASRSTYYDYQQKYPHLVTPVVETRGRKSRFATMVILGGDMGKCAALAAQFERYLRSSASTHPTVVLT